jgi:Ca2+-binding RTX toxin-like protein
LSFTDWSPGEPNGGFSNSSAYLEVLGPHTYNYSGHFWNDAPGGSDGDGYIEEWGGLTGQVAFREDTGTTLTTAQLLTNASDVDSMLTVTSVSAASAHGGTVSLVGNIVTYHPTANFSGADSFTYTVSDGSLTSTAKVSFNVAPVADTFTGTAANDTFTGYGGNDTFDGLSAFDRVDYVNATGAITANLAAGTVDVAGVGTDHLVAIEAIRGSNFADTFDATGFTGDSFLPGTPVGFNEFEGRGGNDTITGLVNSQGAPLTRVSYIHSTGAVTVDFANHFADGNSSVGHDTFIGTIGQVIGSVFGDTFTGSNNPNNTVEVFDGRAGNDTIDGGGGFDRADYAGDSTTTSGITVDLAAGTVSAINPLDVTIGNDTLLSIESIRGTNNSDIYVATGFSGSSINAGSNGTFNEFVGMGGNDQITGNGNTRLSFTNATAAVTVDMQTGWTSTTTGGTPGTGTASGSDSSVGSYTFTGVNAIMGSMFSDTLRGSNNNDTFTGLAGNDFIDGRGGFDVASYNNTYFTTGGISANMTTGVVIGDASSGTDTLRSIEGVQGTNFDDAYVATGYGANGLDPTLYNVGDNGTFNQFEGLGGNDTITGNGNTRAVYVNAAASVTVDIAAGTGQGTIAGDAAHVGQDHFVTGVNSIVGSLFGDFLYGSNNATGTTETFDGRAGDDLIDGRGGFDLVVYNLDGNIDAGITVDMASGTVTSTSSAVGTDTLRSIESITGTKFADIYVASGFSGSSTNAGSFATFNSFNGFGGGDTITGNGNTTIVYANAAAGVTADLQAGISTASGDSNFGTDHFTGVNGITGSNFNDVLSGDANSNFLNGGSGNDRLEGRGGSDSLTGGGGSDTFVYSTGDGSDTINDFNHGQADKIDLSGVGGIYNLNDVMAHATQVGQNTLIDFGFGDSITLTNVTKSTLAAADFGFGNTPYLNGDAITVTESSDHTGITTVQNVTLTDDDLVSNVVLTATAGSGSLSPSGTTDTVGSINAALASGLVYTPTNYQEATNLNDTVTVTATDLQGHSDSLHFVFQQSGSGGATLVGTAGKDIIFSTGGDDMLTGLGGRDNFVFAPHGGTPSHDTITDFTVGLDKLDVRAFGALLSTSPPAAVQQGSDTLITLDSDDTVLLKNVNVSSLHNSDFIFHI